MGVCWEGLLFRVAVGCALVFGVGGIFAELFRVFFAWVFAFWDINDFPGWVWIFLARKFLLLLLGRFFA